MDIYQEILSNLEYLQILNYFQYQTHARFYLEVALDYLENTSFIVQYELCDQAAEKKIYFRRNYTAMLKVLRFTMCCRINAIKYPMYLFCKLLRPGGLCFVYRMDHKNWNRPTILRLKDRSIPRDGQLVHVSPRSLFLVELLQFYILLILTQFQIQNNPSPDYRSKTLRLDNKIENKFNRDAATPYIIQCNILQYITSNYLRSRYSRQLAIRCN